MFFLDHFPVTSTTEEETPEITQTEIIEQPIEIGNF